jgi:anti-sigma B factor antagonist
MRCRTLHLVADRVSAVGELAISDHLVLESEPQDGALVISLYGELDLASAPLLEQGLLDEEAAGAPRLVIDLSGLEFIDSTGLHVLIRAHERARETAQQLLLVRGPRAVQRLFELTGAARVFSFEE